MAGDVRTRLRFQAVRGATQAARETTSGDLLGANTGDMLKYLAVDKEKVQRAIVYVVTADTLTNTVIQLIRTQTIDQAVSAAGATTIDSITITSADSAVGKAWYKNLSPSSGDLDPGEQFVFRMQSSSAGAANGKLLCFVIVEPTSEADENLPYPQRMNQSS